MTADFTVEGRAAGAELADLASLTSQGIYEILLAAPIPEYSEAHLLVQLKDVQGNTTRVDRKFSTKQSYQLTVTKAGSWPLGGGASPPPCPPPKTVRSTGRKSP